MFLSFGPFGTASITAEPQSLATGEPQSLAILDMEGKRYHNLSKILPGKSLFVCFDIAHRHFQEPDLKYVYAYVYVYPPTPPRGRAPEKQGYCEFGGFPVSQVWEPLGAHSLTFFPILMHSLGDVLHPGPGAPCFGGFAGFVALGGSQSHFFPGVPCFGSFAGFATFGGSPLGAHSLPYSSLS